MVHDQKISWSTHVLSIGHQTFILRLTMSTPRLTDPDAWIRKNKQNNDIIYSLIIRLKGKSGWELNRKNIILNKMFHMSLKQKITEQERDRGNILLDTNNIDDNWKTSIFASQIQAKVQYDNLQFIPLPFQWHDSAWVLIHCSFQIWTQSQSLSSAKWKI